MCGSECCAARTESTTATIEDGVVSATFQEMDGWDDLTDCLSLFESYRDNTPSSTP